MLTKLSRYLICKFFGHSPKQKGRNRFACTCCKKRLWPVQQGLRWVAEK